MEAAFNLTKMNQEERTAHQKRTNQKLVAIKMFSRILLVCATVMQYSGVFSFTTNHRVQSLQVMRKLDITEASAPFLLKLSGDNEERDPDFVDSDFINDGTIQHDDSEEQSFRGTGRTILSRKDALLAASSLVASGTLVNHLYTGEGGLLAPYHAYAYDGPPLFDQVRAIENANYIGQPFKKIYEPNTKGAPEKHLPQVSIEPGTTKVTVTVPHVMTPEHYIQFMWLKDAATNEVVLVKALPPTDPSPPSLVATVPEGVTLRPYLFCNLHGLWKGDDFTVSSKLE